MVYDSENRYGMISRALHWGMAILFAAQFFSAGARALLPREDAFRELVWSYHATLGTILFLFVLARGIWGLVNLSSRPRHEGLLGRAATYGHRTLYALMIVVPATRLLAAAGNDRSFTFLGLEVFPAREAEVAWMQLPAEIHGELGWLLAIVILGHVIMAVGWHHLVRRDGTLKRMAR
jgi:cytochrome b561